MNVKVLLALALGLPFAALPCTIFYATDESSVLVGNNEDFDGSIPLKMWLVPSGSFGYARICFGWHSHAQGGMNEHGLFIDWASLPDSSPKAKPNGKPPPDGCMAERALASCANVNDVLRLFESIAYQGNPSHFLAVDKTGNSVVGEWLESGFKPVRKKGKQIITNFPLQGASPKEQQCTRYQSVLSMLGETTEVSVSRFADILSSTAVTFSSGHGTKYSNIYDLTRGEVTLYIERDFTRPIMINLGNELKRGFREVDLYALAANGPGELVPPHPRKTFAPLPSAEHIFARFNAARGNATGDFSSFRLSGTVREGWGDTGTFEFLAAPGRRADTIVFNKLGTYRSGYDGSNAWQVAPLTGPIRVEGAIRDHAQRDAAFYNWQYNPREVVGPVRLASFDGRDCLEVTLRQSGIEARHYFDTETGLLAGILTSTALRSGTTWSRTVYSEWNASDPFPKRIRIQEEGYELTLNMEKVDLNNVPPSRFFMPAAGKD